MNALIGANPGKNWCFLTQCQSLKVKSIQEFVGNLRTLLDGWHAMLLQNTIPVLPSIETAHINQRSFFRSRQNETVAARVYDALGKEIVDYASQR